MPRIVAAMPPRSGVIVRPYAMEADGRAALIRSIRRAGRAKRHVLLIADARAAGFDGRHRGGAVTRLPQPCRNGIESMPVHDERQAARALRTKVSLCLISPVWATRSHPGAVTLGVRGFARLAARLRKDTHVIALGGMTARSHRTLRRHGADGWAAIDGWQVDPA